MPIITPGVDFIAKGTFLLASPVLIALSLGHLHQSAGGRAVPTWLLVITGIASVPLITTFKIVTTRQRHKREAAAMGAKIVPCMPGKWLGNADILKQLRHYSLYGYPGDGLNEAMAEQGPVINLRTFWSDLIFTASPEHIKLILATDFDNYVKGRRFQRSMRDVLGVGVFNSDSDMWKFHRALTRPAFTRDRISDYDLFDRHAQVVIEQLKSRFREGQPVDFQDIMSRFTLDSATEFLFGTCVHSLSAGLPYPHNASSSSFSSFRNINETLETKRANEFSKAFLEAMDAVSSRERYGWVWPLFEIFKDRTKAPMRIVNELVEPLVQEAIRKKNSGLMKEKEKLGEFAEDETLLDHLVQATSDPKVLKDETLNILLAGRDTTAATLAYAVYFLSQYPHAMDRLRQEVLDRIGPNKRPTAEDIHKMRYLRAVINETLRLYPVVPFNIRESIHPTTWPNPDPNDKPFYIPAGTRILYSVFMMHRRKDLWGPDADEFDPDRFLDDRVKKYLVKNSFIFLPFNAGPRICLGQQYAYNEMSFMLVRLVQAFSSISLDFGAFPPGTLPPSEFKSAPGRKGIEKIWPKATLTLYIGGGLWVRMQEANNA